MTKTQDWVDRASRSVEDRLAQTDLQLKPKRLLATEETDAVGDESWRLLLVLSAPDGPTWDREQVFKLRRLAIEYFDDAAAEADRLLPGPTIAFVTTDEAEGKDIAVDDPPHHDADQGMPS